MDISLLETIFDQGNPIAQEVILIQETHHQKHVGWRPSIIFDSNHRIDLSYFRFFAPLGHSDFGSKYGHTHLDRITDTYHDYQVNCAIVDANQSFGWCADELRQTTVTWDK